MKPLNILLLVGVIMLFASRADARSESQEYYSSRGGGHVGYFYSSLAPYGEWLEIDAGLYAWRPVRVQRGWRPYLHGRWAWTDYGWYWVSQEPFGWAVFHYGRWHHDDYYGWIWIPDDVWGPAWVEWRYSDDYIGWAPLPPYASFSFSFGIRFSMRWSAPHHYWSFVPCGNFGSHSLTRYVLPSSNTRRIIGYTRTTSRYDVTRDRIINRGVDRSFLERRGHTRFDRTEVQPSRERGERIVREGNRERIEMYQPERREMEQRDVRIEATRPERRISLDFDRIEQRRSDPQRETRDTREQERDNNPRSIERPRERQDERGESQRREITPQPERKGREQLSRPSSSESQRPAFDPRRIERKEPQAERKIERNNAPQPKVRREPAKPSSEQRSSQSSGRSQSTGKKRGQ